MLLLFVQVVHVKVLHVCVCVCVCVSVCVGAESLKEPREKPELLYTNYKKGRMEAIVRFTLSHIREDS